MNVTHPLADRDAPTPAAVTATAGTYAVDADGVVDCPDDVGTAVAEDLAEAYDVEPDALVYEEDGPPDDTGLSFDPSEHTVDEVEDHVATIDGDDIVAELEALRAAEANGKDRKGALEAIDSRLDDLTED